VTEAGDELSRKFDNLVEQLKDQNSALLAFSGGVDSSFLLKALKISGIRFLAVIGRSQTMPRKELEQAISFAENEGAPYRIIDTGEMSSEDFLSNTPDRCFHCKDDLFKRLVKIAEDEGLEVVFDGSNADDLQDYRPGRKAAEALGVRSPLAEAGLTKSGIRELSKKLGLSTWDKPSAPCLSSRFPYGQRITEELLKRVEKAEDFIKGLGIRTVRVRAHNDVARIEVTEDDMPLLLERRLEISSALKAAGFTFVSLDLEGFRSGSLNRVL
jgi:uncharacterized protein